MTKQLDISALVKEYGAGNLRFFITEPTNQGFFANPFGGMQEYVLTKRYDATTRYKIGLGLVHQRVDTCMPDWFNPIMNERSFYVSDLESRFERAPEDHRIYVLVDETNEYERLA